MAPRAATEARRQIGAVRLPVRRLHLELTSRCNFACEFCPARRLTRPHGELALGTVARLLAEAGAGGLAQEAHFHVLGEPLLYPELARAIRLARESGLRPWVTTNASLLTPERLRELRGAGLEHLTVSLQTPDAATFGIRGCAELPFEAYRERLLQAVRAHLAEPSDLEVTLSVLVNPLRRFHAPGAPRHRVAQSGPELRQHLARWVEAIFAGTPHAPAIPALLARTARAGILMERRIPLAGGVAFQVRALGSWAEHFQAPVRPAFFGYCPGLTEHLGVLCNGDYVLCCADYDGQTVLANAGTTSLAAYLALPEVQAIAAGFRRFRVVHPHCRRCLGDRRRVDVLLRGVGSILYFKVYRPLMRRDGCREAG